MPDKERETLRDTKGDVIAASLAAGMTVLAAAAKHGVDEGTIWRWKREDQSFREMIRRVRGEIYEHAISELLQVATDAVKAMKDVLKRPGQKGARVKLDAAKTMLELCAKGRKDVDWEDRWQEMEIEKKQKHTGK